MTPTEVERWNFHRHPRSRTPQVNTHTYIYAGQSAAGASVNSRSWLHQVERSTIPPRTTTEEPPGPCPPASSTSSRNDVREPAAAPAWPVRVDDWRSLGTSSPTVTAATVVVADDIAMTSPDSPPLTCGYALPVGPHIRWSDR